MASEKAQSIHRAYLNGCALVGVIVREGILYKSVDAELLEVRGVLDGLQSLGQKGCWCRFAANGEHSITCQRARALYEKLRVDK